eukprot:903407-Amphidinium_carterae.2
MCNFERKGSHGTGAIITFVTLKFLNTVTPQHEHVSDWVTRGPNVIRDLRNATEGKSIGWRYSKIAYSKSP